MSISLIDYSLPLNKLTNFKTSTSSHPYEKRFIYTFTPNSFHVCFQIRVSLFSTNMHVTYPTNLIN